MDVLRPGGRLAFITSGNWVRANFGAPLRGFLSANAKMESIVDFGEFQPFEDVQMIRPSITVLSKDRPGGEIRLFKRLTASRLTNRKVRPAVVIGHSSHAGDLIEFIPT